MVRFHCQREKTPEGAKLPPGVFRETAHWLIDGPLEIERGSGEIPAPAFIFIKINKLSKICNIKLNLA